MGQPCEFQVDGERLPLGGWGRKGTVGIVERDQSDLRRSLLCRRLPLPAASDRRDHRQQFLAQGGIVRVCKRQAHAPFSFWRRDSYCWGVPHERARAGSSARLKSSGPRPTISRACSSQWEVKSISYAPVYSIRDSPYNYNQDVKTALQPAASLELKPGGVVRRRRGCAVATAH